MTCRYRDSTYVLQIFRFFRLFFIHFITVTRNPFLWHFCVNIIQTTNRDNHWEDKGKSRRYKFFFRWLDSLKTEDVGSIINFPVLKQKKKQSYMTTLKRHSFFNPTYFDYLSFYIYSRSRSSVGRPLDSAWWEHASR